MTKNEYLQKRKDLLAKGQGFTDQGKLEDADKVMQEIIDLDEKYEEIAKAQANLNALQEPKNLTGHDGIKNVVGNSSTTLHSITMEDMENKDDKLYHQAFMNHLLDIPLSNDQSDVFNKINSDIKNLDTGSTGIVIPKTTSNKIWEKVNEMFPFYSKVLKTSVKGNLELIQEDSSTDAKFYSEDEVTKDGDEKLKTFNLTGCELSRSIPVSFKLKEMSMEDFEAYIVRKMARKMGMAAAHSAMTGKGKPGQNDDFKAEPYGVVTVLKAETKKPQIVAYTGAPTMANITSLIAKVKGYNGSFYAKGTFIWDVLVHITDKQGRPYFVPNPADGGVGKMFGKTVFEDDTVLDGEMLYGDAEMYQINFNKQITLDTEIRKKARMIDYLGYAIIDGAPITTEAFSLLTKDAAA